ncbi:hypothetical protein [Nitrosomonas sp. Nm58]|uniref:hypothetical protein n=1 Tax=Nitrosomonas sp. Nm58 TaxID=200126 RepID=UPI0008944A2A|nr:hypothetical protein [Nitrosomonas sp. Nm58]SDY38987.1 hypothetical protein SAMN05421754_100865 [Nitrosomonas sp. Nm58]
MSFEKLLDELETMSKAMPSDDTGEDDKKIQAAAAEGGEGDVSDENENVDGNEEESDDDPSDDEVEVGDENMTKSFQFTLDSGEIIEAQDGTKLVKSLMNRIEKNEGTLTKALGTAVTLIKSQGDMIKSLQEKIGQLSGQGRGRKAVVSVVEKQPTALVKSAQEEGMSSNEFMTKALSAQASGKITGNDVARAEAYLNKGMPIPSDIVSRVIS